MSITERDNGSVHTWRTRRIIATHIHMRNRAKLELSDHSPKSLLNSLDWERLQDRLPPVLLGLKVLEQHYAHRILMANGDNGQFRTQPESNLLTPLEVASHPKLIADMCNLFQIPPERAHSAISRILITQNQVLQVTVNNSNR